MKIVEAEINESGNPELLIESIRQAAVDAVKSIEKRTDEEIQAMQREAKTEIDNFRNKIESDSEKSIQKEQAKINNRLNLDKKKLYLNEVNQFMEDIIKASIEEFTQNREAYSSYLLRNIMQCVERNGLREFNIFLSEKDMDITDKLSSNLHDNPKTAQMTLKIHQEEFCGGFIIEDIVSGLSYNYTIERVIYRHKELIRKEMMKLMKDYRK